MVRLALGPRGVLLLLAVGARGMRAFGTELLARLPAQPMIRDWYHLHQQGPEPCRRIGRGKEAKRPRRLRLDRRVWRGDVRAAIAALDAHRSQARNTAALERLITYRQAGQAPIPNERPRRIAQQSSGRGHVENANELLVARRQQARGMPWSWDTSAALTALRTLMLNRGWDHSWQPRQVLPRTSS
jgi:hypothetical protein